MEKSLLSVNVYVVVEHQKYSDAITVHGSFVDYDKARLCLLEKSALRSSSSHKPIQFADYDGSVDNDEINFMDCILIGDDCFEIILKYVNVD